MSRTVAHTHGRHRLLAKQMTALDTSVARLD